MKKKRKLSEKQLVARALFEKRKKVLEKFLKKIPAGAELARQMASLKDLEAKGYSSDFLLNDFSLDYKCNYISHLYSLKEEMDLAKGRAKLNFEVPEAIKLQDEKLGGDGKVEKTPDLREFLKNGL